MNIQLKLRSLEQADGQCSRTDSTAAGTLTETPDGWQLVYTEPEDAGVAQTTVQLKTTAAKPTAQITRTGAVRSDLLFEQGARRLGRLVTPYGVIPLRIFTRTLAVSLDARRGGSVTLCYTLALSEADAAGAAHELHMDITPAE